MRISPISRRNSALPSRDRRGCDSRGLPNSPGASSLEEFDALQPFRALPEIEMRHHQPHRAAMVLLQRLARPAVREQGVLGGEILQREIGGVAVMGMQHHEPRLVARLAGHQQIAGGEPFPLVVVARPGGDAMDVGDELRLRLRGELGKVPEHRMSRPRRRHRAASARAICSASGRDRAPASRGSDAGPAAGAAPRAATIFPVRNFPSRAQRCLLRVSLLSGGGWFRSSMSAIV